MNGAVLAPREHFRAKRMPVRAGKMRQSKKLFSDSIGMENTQARRCNIKDAQ